MFFSMLSRPGEQAREVGGVVGGDLSAQETSSSSRATFGYCPGPVVRRRHAPASAVKRYVGLFLRWPRSALEAGATLPCVVLTSWKLAPFIETYRAAPAVGVRGARRGRCSGDGPVDGPAADAARMATASNVVIGILTGTPSRRRRGSSSTGSDLSNGPPVNCSGR